MTVRKIISGGQTGADQGGLEAGKELGLETGGTAPYNWKTEKGMEKVLLQSYGLVPGPFDPRTYPKRTRKNVQDSDGTVWFGRETSPGGRLTLGTARKEGKPYCINPSIETFLQWIEKCQTQVLNIAGNREETNPGIQKRTRDFLVEALKG